MLYCVTSFLLPVAQADVHLPKNETTRRINADPTQTKRAVIGLLGSNAFPFPYFQIAPSPPFLNILLLHTVGTWTKWRSDKQSP